MIQNDVFGLIYTGEENTKLGELVSKRNVAAMPVGGRYRVIDFMLSNMVNSNIRNIGVITRKNYQSLMDHIDSGKEWDLSRKRDGLFILPPYDTKENTGMHEGTVDAIAGAGAYIRRAKQQYCLFTSSSLIYNMVYDGMVEQHMKTGADITVLYCERGQEKCCSASHYSNLFMNLAEDGRMVDAHYSSNADEIGMVGMDCVLIRKDLLKYLLDNALSRNKHDLIRDIIIENVNRLKIYGYRHKGYVAKIDSIAGYYKTNMDILKPEVQASLFYTGNNIYTKSKDEPPAKYGKHAKVTNCLIGSGCIIEGTVENSILFRGVYVAKGVTIKNSIIMQDSRVYEKASLDKVILDKNVNIRPHSNLVGNESYPVIIPKGAIA